MKYLLGVRFKLKGDQHFITGPVNINDISVNGTDKFLICQSEDKVPSSLSSSSGNWYLHPESQSTDMDDRLGDSERGWIRTRTTTTADYRQVILKRQLATGAHEGRFTCQIGWDMNPKRSLFVLYPSEL